MSASLKTIMVAAESPFQSHQHHAIGLRDFMLALRWHVESVSFFREHGIRFREDLDGVESEAAERDEAGSLRVEEVVKLFDTG